jgi:ankyrin repeat protein
MDEEFKDIPQSPLHSAVYYSHYSAVRFLVEKGFDVFRLNTEGRTPCQLADEDDHEIIDILRRGIVLINSVCIICYSQSNIRSILN